MNSIAFSPSPQVRYSIPLAKVPLRGSLLLTTSRSRPRPATDKGWKSRRYSLR